MDKRQKSWSESKHEPSKRTHVSNLIRGLLETELKMPTTPIKPIVNLGLGMFNLQILFYL